MRNKIIFAFIAIIMLSSCADDNVNKDLYDKSNPVFASQPAIPANDPSFDNYSYFNLAIQWGNFIDKQTMRGVYFPHDIHRNTLKGATFLNKNGHGQVFITGCTSCHGNDSTNRLFMQQYLAETNRKIAGVDKSNPAHEFCWTTCHNQIPEPNNAPNENQCASCHKVENLRAK